MNTASIVSKVWSFCTTLRDDGVTRSFQGKLEPYSYTPLDDVTAVAARVEAYRYAARRSAFGSALEQQSEEKLKERLQLEPAKPDAIAAFVARFGTPAQK